MSTTESFQIPLEAAEAYEERFVPGLFAEWAPRLLDAAGARRGERLLDVACGTGIVTRTAADRLTPACVVGVDLNEAMLTVARRVRPDLDYRQGDAAALPFSGGEFEVAVCQMALMFFPEPLRAVRELARVVAPGGRVALAVPASLELQPAYGPFVAMAVEHAGPESRRLLGTYFACGDAAWLERLAADAGLTNVRVERRIGTARFPSVDAFVATEVEATPLAARLDVRSLAAIRRGAREVLAPFTFEDDALAAPFAVQLVVATRPEEA
jgi:ubiquinone/menaquinone biosynthesis C-methylase UbiE